MNTVAANPARSRFSVGKFLEDGGATYALEVVTTIGDNAEAVISKSAPFARIPVDAVIMRPSTASLTPTETKAKATGSRLNTISHLEYLLAQEASRKTPLTCDTDKVSQS